MACPICKAKVITILENYKAIDKILFPNIHPKNQLSESDYKTYKTIKKSFLLNILEINNINNYISKEKYSDINELIGKSISNVSDIISEVRGIMSSDKCLDSINENISIENPDRYILEQFLSIALDKLTLEQSIQNSSGLLTENYKGKIIFSAYKSFKNDLIQLALKQK